MSTVTMPITNVNNSTSSINSYQSEDDAATSNTEKEKINKCSHNVSWFIDSALIRAFSESETKQLFDSTSFQLYRSKWCLQCYPNGDRYANTGMVSLYLKLLEFPESSEYHIKNIKVIMKFECNDVKYVSNEFVHTYENKKQEVYFGISSAFNTYQLNQLSHIAIKCRIDLITVSIDGEKWWHCMRERDALRAKAKRIEHEAKEQNKKLQTSYICNKVINIKENAPKIREKIKKANDESKSVLNEHREILKEWDATTKLLSKVIGNDCNVEVLENNLQPNGDAEDKKENDVMNGEENDDEWGVSDGYRLLSAHAKCMRLMDEQNNRLEQVSNNVYALLSQQTHFIQSIDEWNTNAKTGKDDYTKMLKKYNQIMAARMKMQKILQKKVNECNAKIDEENSYNKKKCRKNDELNSINLEVKVFESMSKECRALIERYNEFVKVNNGNIDKLNTFILSKWSAFEKKWIEWTARDIMAFIKYKMNWFDIHLLHIDLKQIEENMLRQQMNGVSIKKFAKSDLTRVGFTNYQLRCQIFDHFRVLRTKYPPPTTPKPSPTANGTSEERNEFDEDQKQMLSQSRKRSESVESTGHNIIPSKFMCPITKNLMRDPVMAFDGYTYERSAIVEYLEKHNKSPMTQKSAHILHLFPNLQIKQEIETFREVNDILMEGTEGNEEITSFID